MVASFLTIYNNNMTFSLRKIGLQQSDLTMIMIMSCLHVDIRNLFSRAVYQSVFSIRYSH